MANNSSYRIWRTSWIIVWLTVLIGLSFLMLFTLMLWTLIR